MSRSVVVEIGYDDRECILTNDEWDQVSLGQPLSKEVIDHYEGEEFLYTFHFNHSDKGSLSVDYLYANGEDVGEGFVGRINDACVTNV